MQPRTAALILLAFAMTASAQTTQNSTWELREGRWQQLPKAPTTQAVVRDAELDRIEKMLNDGQWKSARTAALAWEKANKASPQRDRGLYLLAQADYQADQHIKAFYQLDELLDYYKDSRYFYPALEMQYKIADEYLSGYKDTWLGMRILSREGEAIEMMFRIQQTSPGSQLAEKALLRTADYYYQDLQYDLAADAYGMYCKSYPRSPIVPKAKLRQAFSSLAQFRGTKFDPTPLIDARTQLLDISQQYPQLASDENVSMVIEKIDATFAAKLFQKADYYRRTHAYDAAVFTYRLLIETYPLSSEAQNAKNWLDRMPASALATKPPPEGISYQPLNTQGPVRVRYGGTSCRTCRRRSTIRRSGTCLSRSRKAASVSSDGCCS
jgi:outer membrane assembly lipoprotein YfiO